MPSTTYDVRASLLLQTRGAYGDVRKLGQEVRSLGDSLKVTESHARQAINQMLAFGGAVLGVRAVAGAFTSLTRSAVAYSAELEKNKIGLQSVLMAVENTDWETAGRRASKAFEEIRLMAIESPATSAEMFEIFNGIVGPVEAAGFAMNKVLDLTKDTTLAAAALGVDYQQASRDINMMVRGTAGMEVKLFSMLRSTGAIKEDTETWNKMNATDRVNKLGEALKKFSAGASAFGKSWAGVTSTLQDIFSNLKATAFGPIMKVVAENIDRFNQMILANRVSIEAFLLNVGRDAANRIETVFVKMRSGFQYIVENWDQIVARFDTVTARVKEIAPVIAKAALAWELVNVGRNVAGGAISAGGSILGAAGQLGEWSAGMMPGKGTPKGRTAAELGGLFGQWGAATGAAAPSMAGLFGQWGAATGGGALAAGGGGGAAAGAAGGAAGGTGIVSTLVALAPVLGLVAAALVLLLSVGLAFKEQWRSMTVIFGESGGQLASMLFEFGKALWDALAPILKILGSVLLVPLTAIWTVLSTTLKALLLGFTGLLKIIGAITNAIYQGVKPAFDLIFQLFAGLTRWLNDLFSKAMAWLKKVETAPVESGAAPPSHDPNTDYSRWLAPAPLSSSGMDISKAPKGAVVINQDFRGSRFSVRQEFKGDQDPDRIVMAMMQDLTRQAENRVSSGYAGALTR